MVFRSQLPLPAPPSADVFNYVFSEGRHNYPKDRVLYRVHETDETLTLNELEEKSRRFASVLTTTYNIQPDDVIAFLANNSIWYPVAFFGVLAAGATISPVPVQTGLDAQSVAPRLQQANAKLVITDAELHHIAQGAATLAGDIPLVSLDAVAGENVAELQRLLPHGDATVQTFRLRTTEELNQHSAFIYRTSGSSGNIKSVLTTHGHWVANLISTKLTLPEDTDPDQDVWVSGLPFAYGINAKLNLGLNILLGIPVVILRKPFDQSSLPLIDQYGITFLFVTPPLAAQIAKSEKQDGKYASLKWLLSAGAPVHPKIRDAVQERLNGVRLSLEWGTTETLLIALQIDDKSAVPGSSGTLVNGVEAKVLDLETGQEQGPNQQGEILVRNSLARFAGYKDNEEANRDFDEDGWFHSGDVGYIDENANVFIVDRLKELLRVGDGYGTHLSTTELESALFDHPAVGTAVVVGIRNEDTQQEHPTAFVILQSNYRDQASSALAEEIERFVEHKVGVFKRISGGVYFVSKYPQVGYKIDRRTLKGLVNVGTGSSPVNRFIEISA